MKAIIVGGGIMGLATAWALARDGHEVELLEQGPLPIPLAPSMDEHRLIRHPYGDHRGYARMVDNACGAWDLLWGDLGQRLYAAIGTLALTGNGETWAPRTSSPHSPDISRRSPASDCTPIHRSARWISNGPTSSSPTTPTLSWWRRAPGSAGCCPPWVVA